MPEGSHFPMQNLPLGRVRSREGQTTLAIRIGDHVVPLSELCGTDFLQGRPDWYVSVQAMLEKLGDGAFEIVRRAAYEMLLESNPAVRDDSAKRDQLVREIEDYEVLLPMDVEAFVDFYSGINHASNVGRMFRPDMPPLLPNYRHLPVGYNGRASSVVVSGTPIRRPSGQTKAADQDAPSFGPTQELDFELEMGFYTSKENGLGEPVPISMAEDFIFGYVLVNDWSARDVQRWEYQPLGPFLAKSFATSISPWIVSQDALDQFRIPGPLQEPEVLPHLRPTKPGHFDIQLEVSLKTQAMSKGQVICHSNARDLYWSFAQQLAHQTSNGTPIEAGDLYASGTISGLEPDTFGSLLELTWRGSKPITLQETGETRTFLEDGDTLTISGWCEKGSLRLGFGEVSGTILPAK